jgi:peptidoglycan/LPS O-acetylase OafA/YrhL
METTQLDIGRVPTRGRVNNFDLLRLILAILVILSHSYILMDGKDASDPLAAIFHGVTLGELAVDGFFLLSGYLIVQSWDSEARPVAFLKKRVLRIYPGFIVAALVSALVVGPLGTDASRYFAELDIYKLVKSIAVLKVPAVPATFDGYPFPTVNGSMWTIFFEFLCYMAVLAFGVAGAIRLPRYWLAISLVIVITGIVQKLTHIFPDQNFYLPILRFSTFFFIGGCFYLYREKIRFSPGLALLCGVFLLIGISHKEYPELVLAAGAGYLLFYLAFWRRPALIISGKFPDVSYGVYLYGWPVQKLLLWYVPGITPKLLFVASLAIALGLGMLSWYAIEKPFMKMKNLQWSWKKVRLTYD